MKTKKLKLLTTFLLLLPLCVVLLGAGCDDDDENYENIPLEYTKCPCDSEKSFIEKVTMNKILLFDTTKITFYEMQKLSLVGDSSQFISYNPENNNVIYYSYTYGGIYESVGYICNFPEASSEWIIPYDGMCVSYSADVFESCNPHGAIEFFYSEFEIVLTSLKKYEE